jgi:hypothetical protein
MTATVKWFDDKKNLIHQHYQGIITMEDFKMMAEKSHALAISVTHAVDILMEFEDANLADFRRMVEISYVESTVPSNQRFVYAINIPTALKAVSKMLRNFAPNALGSVSFVDTLEEALLLREQHLQQLAEGKQPLMRET